MKIPKLLILCMVSIALFGSICNFSSNNIRKITSRLAQCSGELCTLEIADDHEAWALAFLGTSDHRSLLQYVDNSWHERTIPFFDPHLLALTQDNTLFVVARTQDYQYALWRMQGSKWDCLGELESEYGYPTVLVACSCQEAAITLCPCRGSNAEYCNVYCYSNNVFKLKPNYVISTQACISDDNELMLSYITATMSDNLIKLTSLSSKKNIVIPKTCVGLVFKNFGNSYSLISTYDKPPSLYRSRNGGKTWTKCRPNKTFNAVMKGIKNKCVYVLDSSGSLFKYL